MSISQTYIEYGVSSEIAIELEKKDLPLSTFRETKREHLLNWVVNSGFYTYWKVKIS